MTTTTVTERLKSELRPKITDKSDAWLGLWEAVSRSGAIKPLFLSSPSRIVATAAQGVELVVGQVVSLGRPLAGPFEVRAAGRVIGHGELVDIEGELGVRIVALQ